MGGKHTTHKINERAYEILVGKSEGESPVERPRRR
jgi:hypothetical protein